MKWRTLTKDKARELMETYKDIGIGSAPTHFDDDTCRQLRDALLGVWQEAEQRLEERGVTLKTNEWYPMDMEFGLGLYRVLTAEPFCMTPRQAADTGIWRYIAVILIPDLVTKRWPDPKSWEARIFSKPRRIFPKFLWWYIYLCWQGSEEDTRYVIMDNSEDTILQLVDRAGANGYRPELYRKIARMFLEYPGEENHDELFRRVMKLNTARMVTTEPELTEGGIPQYVKELFEYISKK